MKSIARRESRKGKRQQAFISFILKDPLVYSKPGNKLDQRLFIPFTRESLPAKVTLKLREYGACIDKDNEGVEKCVR